MFQPALRARTRSWAPAFSGLIAAGGFMSLAHAAPPAFTGQALTVPIPVVGGSVIVNVRQQGVISGSAPIQIESNEGVPTVFINGEPTFVLSAGVFGPDAFGAVCVEIFNNDYTPQPDDAIEIGLTLFNPQQETASALVPLVNGSASVVDPEDPAQVNACGDPNAAPLVNAGPDRTVADSDGAAGESVTLSGSATDPEGDVLTFEWFSGTTRIATGPAPVVALPDGANTLTLRATDEAGATATDTVVITVTASAGPSANAGVDRTVADSDGEPGESVTLDASLSSDADGSIVRYEWFRQTGAETEETLGEGVTLAVTLPDGENTIRLLVTDNVGLTGSDTVLITVGAAPEPTVLSELPNLTPQQRRVANAVDRICDDLFALDAGQAALTAEQRQLLERCGGLLFNNSTDNQIDALDELVEDDFAAARTQTLVFANAQFGSIMDRLIALRGGAKGLSLAGLNIIVDGKSVPLAQLEEFAQEMFGGGASADEPGGLLSDRWGLWARGNYSFGEKDANGSSPAFDADQWSLVGGLDYRLSDSAVIGLSVAYGDSSIEFSPSDEGSLDTQSWAASFYGSMYAAKNFYFDAILNVADANFDARRNITYVDGSGLVDFDARGETDGLTLSGGVSGGYDFLLGGLTLSPGIGFFYIDTTIDSFTEQGAGGLNLIYDEQKFESLTGNLGLRLTYAWNVSWGVLLPHLRFDYVREFEDDVDVFGVRFAADPNAASAPPILVETDNPDESYWRLAAGFSAQFKFGFSGYIEYQRLEGFEFISFQDVSIGLRMQRSF